jgi:hypothetical protein
VHFQQHFQRAPVVSCGTWTSKHTPHASRCITLHHACTTMESDQATLLLIYTDQYRVEKVFCCDASGTPIASCGIQTSKATPPASCHIKHACTYQHLLETRDMLPPRCDHSQDRTRTRSLSSTTTDTELRRSFVAMPVLTVANEPSRLVLCSIN